MGWAIFKKMALLIRTLFCAPRLILSHVAEFEQLTGFKFSPLFAHNNDVVVVVVVIVV